MFQPHSNESVADREERILALWKQTQAFEKSLENRKSAKRFAFYDGPPFATGLPHYGHILAGTLKDVVPRYKTMQGFYVERRFGWDCHGLPVENEIEKAKELSGAPSIEKFGIAAFNEECRSIVLKYSEQWQSTVERMGRWVSFDQTYKTMDPSFMESVWWVFAELHKKELIYEGFKVMPFSTRLGTPLSNFEANLNYKEVDDPSLTVKLRLLDEPGTFLLIWTTTPWTLPSNLAVMVGPETEYVKIRQLESQEIFVIGVEALARYFKEASSYEVLQTFLGAELVGKRYEPLFSYFSDRASQGAFQVIAEESVSSEEGTGLVHSAPAFGEVDFFACAKEGIELVNPVDHNGKFTEEIPDFAGQFVKDADKGIIRFLKAQGKVFQQSTVKHRYPFCWRSDTPLIYKAVSTWFVAVEKVKEKILSANEQIHWVPGHIKKGRFGKWLENARDWSISRNRYWGTPIPLWRSEDGEVLVISSVKELEEKTQSKVTDLHRHFIDSLEIEHEGKVYKRISEVFDCWFESGSMPYAQDHYPFENREKVESAFPADFIAEGLDQTRGWFYTLNVLSSILFNQPAFKNVIVNGLILAEDGRKMSKRLKNYPEPLSVVSRLGADAVRLYLLNSPVVRAEDLRFSERGVELTLRQVLIPLWNSFIFLSTYAQIYKWTPQESSNPPEAEIDRWILSLLQKLTADVTEAMDSYEIDRAVEPFVSFIDQLTNWYIRRSRSRFWSEEDSLDRRQAFETLYTVLITLTKIIAPFVPFISEAIYLELKKESDPFSVHLCDYHQVNSALRNEELEREMVLAQVAVSLGHALRKEHKLKVRQPLEKAYLVSSQHGELSALKRKGDLIADELNVKEVVFDSDESTFVSLSIKPQFRNLGKKVGKRMPAVQKAIEQLSSDQKQEFLEHQKLKIEIEGESLELGPEDVEIARQAKSGLVALTSGSIVVALDTALTDELLLEGLARELINRINTLRKETGLAVTDRITLHIQETPRLKQAFKVHGQHIQHETLTTQVHFICTEGPQFDLNGELTQIAVKKD